ncbi:ubiquitin-related domain-containing protein [Mycena vitilis]|nr:ubiquitin-related domain-containing protein [Mycena vitilis]
MKLPALKFAFLLIAFLFTAPSAAITLQSSQQARTNVLEQGNYLQCLTHSGRLDNIALTNCLDIAASLVDDKGPIGRHISTSTRSQNSDQDCVGGTFMIFVETLTKKTVTLEVQAFNTVEDIKARIQYEEGIPPDIQRLFLDGAALQNGRTLCDYDVRPESVIILKLRL